MNRYAALTGGIVFLAVTALALYRLMVGFQISIGGAEIGQTTTFFALVAGAALTLMFFRAALSRD
jgi:hypothetical protein